MLTKKVNMYAGYLHILEMIHDYKETAAIGSFLTGLLYSHLTNWGYLKHYWIIVKWVFTITFIVIGFSG